MKVVILSIIFSFSLGCEKNCFLGGIFFSAPLDANGCCIVIPNDKCVRYVQVNHGYFMCDRCEIGYEWSNNECHKIKDSRKCINPEMKTVPFYQCQICKYSENEPLVPIFNPDSEIKYSC